jgi:carbon monoxide dehydrogenase subunit G
MALTIEETFTVRTPSDRVWRYLIDPRQVVSCLPGAELVAVEDERTFLGKVKLKVGPVTAAYSGRAHFAEVNEPDRRVQIVAQGREAGGPGSAKMTMTSELATLPGDTTEVRVRSQMDVAGKVAQFGRGMMEGVTRQLFRQFAECVRARLEEAPADDADTTRATSGAGAAPIRVIPVAAKAAREAIRKKLHGEVPEERDRQP